MSNLGVHRRFGTGASALTNTYTDRWPILTAWDNAGELLATFTDDMTPDAAVRFAADLAAAAQKFADATKAEAARRRSETPVRKVA